MSDTTAKLRAVALAGLMVLSVFAMTIAFSGSAVAVETERGENPIGTWNTADGEGDVGNGGVVFQGEDDITFTWDDTGETYNPEELTNNDDDPLSVPIDSDADTTSYSDSAGDYNVIVRNPEISDHEFRLGTTGGDVAGGTVPANVDNMTVWAEYNFGQAEDLDLTVLEDGDLDVTDEVAENATRSALAQGPDDEVEFDLDLSELDSGEYTIELEGVDDLTGGDATVSDNFTIGTDENVNLELAESEVVKGDNVRFDVEGGLEDNYHVVSLDTSDVTGNPMDVFRDVGDTVRANASDGTAWALVEIDGGVGTGSIETGHLDDSSVQVTVSEPVESEHVSDNASVSDWDGNEIPDDADETSLTVTEGNVSLENPTGFYVPGAEVTVNGTVASSYNEVSVFARDQGEFERVEINNEDTIAATDGEFEAEDVDLVNDGSGGGNRMLGLPGTYRFAIVAGDAGGLDTLTSSQLVRNVSDIVSLRVSEEDLEVNATTINGQVAVGDGIDVYGAAPGADEVSITFFGSRGEIGADSTTVRSDGTFEAEDISVQNPPFPADVEISRGSLVMSVGHDGRDGQPGDGTFPGRFTQVDDVSSKQEMILHANGMHPNTTGASFTQQQAIDFMSAETTEDTGSDDVSEVFQLRLTDPRTSIDQVAGESGASGEVQIGSEMSVQGTTNRQPEQNSLTVEVVEGPSQQEFDLATTDEWGVDGQWNVSLPTEGLQPGTYTVEASDGETSDVMEFELVEGTPSGGGNDTPTEEPLQQDTPEPSTPDQSTPDQSTPDQSTPVVDGDDGGDGGDTDGGDGPGFGVVVALVALVAAALMAVRRNGN